MKSKIIYCILFSLLSITLKLFGVITWSWVWVLSAFIWVPVLAMSALFIALALLVFVLSMGVFAWAFIEFICECFKVLWKRKNEQIH